MHTLSLLYFPKVAAQMEALRLAAIRLDTALQKLEPDEAMAATEEFANARRAAMQAIQNHSKRYT